MTPFGGHFSCCRPRRRWYCVTHHGVALFFDLLPSSYFGHLRVPSEYSLGVLSPPSIAAIHFLLAHVSIYSFVSVINFCECVLSSFSALPDVIPPPVLSFTWIIFPPNHKRHATLHLRQAMEFHKKSAHAAGTKFTTSDSLSGCQVLCRRVCSEYSRSVDAARWEVLGKAIVPESP